MQSLKKFYFGKQKVKVPNTFIGGIGGTINTPALLATKLGINVNRIKLFKVTGVDVECAIIGGSYLLVNSSFNTDQNITYFIDNDGLVSSSSGFSFRADSYGISLDKLRTIYMPNCINFTSTDFRGRDGLRRVVIPRALYGASSVNNSVFASMRFLAGNCVFYVNPANLTVNSGGEDPDLTALKGWGQTIRYVTNFTSPNAITNLTTGQIYNTAIQLNFIPPISTNTIDFYEVYVNDSVMPYAEITSSGQFITGLTPSTNYNIKIVVVDIFYNKSVISNVIKVSTNTADYDAYSYINISSNQAFETPIVNLFNSLKSNNLYNKIQAFYPFLGTTQAQHKWNAKNPQDTNTSFRLVFSGGGTHSNLGYQCNGTNSYANTFLVPSAVQNLNSNGLTITVGTNNVTTKNDAVEIGSIVSVTQASLITSKSNNTNLRRVSRMNGETIFQDNQNDAKGIFTSVKQSSTVTKLLRNKVEIASGNSGGTLPTVSVFIGNLSLSGSPYTDGWSNQRIQFTAIHEGLTDAEVVALHTIIDNFESAIGRKTW